MLYPVPWLSHLGHHKNVIVEMAKKIRHEMKDICSHKHDSILRDDNEGVRHFSWETVWLELLDKMPTLMNLLGCLISDPQESKPLLCLIVSMLLKNQLRSNVPSCTSTNPQTSGCSEGDTDILSVISECFSESSIVSASNMGQVVSVPHTTVSLHK